MSKVQILRGFTLHVLTTAAEEICEQFERTIAEYEEQLCRLREENETQKKLLDAVYNPTIRLYKPVQQKEKEQLRGPEEDLLKVIVMKREAPGVDEENQPKSPCTSSLKEAEAQTENCSELKMFQEGSSLEKNTEIEPFICSICAEIFKDEMELIAHMMHHGAEKPYSCSACFQNFTWLKELEDHECVTEAAEAAEAAEASEKQSDDSHQEEAPEQHSGPPGAGSHQVFTDLDSFLSCTAKVCVFCRTEKRANEEHLRKKHLREAMYFLDDSTEKFAVACFCKEAPDSKRSHYHCPFCGYRTLGREFNFKQHMRKIHGITAGKIKGFKVYDVKRTRSEHEEPLCASPEENEQEPLDPDLDAQLYTERSAVPGAGSHGEAPEQHSGPTGAGSHQVFTDLDSFLSCTAEVCVFCRTEKMANEGHLRKKHLKEAVYFLDDTQEKFVVACFCNETSDSKRSHYHCPYCEYRAYVREFNFKQHLQKLHKIPAVKIKGREWAKGPWKTDTSQFVLPPGSVRGKDDKDDGDRPHSSQLHQRQTEDMETGADGEDYGGPDPEAEVNSEDSSELDTDDSVDWRDQTDHQSGYNSKIRKKPHRCPECRELFETKRYLVRHMRIHLGEKPFSCSVCDKEFLWKGNLKKHMEIHKKRNPPAALGVVEDDVGL